VVPQGTASPRGSLEAEFSLPRPRSRLIYLGLATAPIPEKLILLLQLIAFIEVPVTSEYEQNWQKYR